MAFIQLEFLRTFSSVLKSLSLFCRRAVLVLYFFGPVAYATVLNMAKYRLCHRAKRAKYF